MDAFVTAAAIPDDRDQLEMNLKLEVIYLIIGLTECIQFCGYT